MNKLLLPLLLLAPLAQADEAKTTDYFTFGGWSYHSEDTEKEKYPFNENHNGLGYERYWKRDQDNYSFGAGAWYMTDSYHMKAYHVALNYRYHISPRLTANLALTYMNRGERTKDTLYSSKGTDLTEYEVKRTNMVVLVPYLTINVVDNLNLDVMFMPNFEDDVGVTFARLSYKF